MSGSLSHILQPHPLPGLAAHPCPGTPTVPASSQSLRSELVEVTEWLTHHPSSALWKLCNFQTLLDHRRWSLGLPIGPALTFGKGPHQSPHHAGSVSLTLRSWAHCLCLIGAPLAPLSGMSCCYLAPASVHFLHRSHKDLKYKSDSHSTPVSAAPLDDSKHEL